MKNILSVEKIEKYYGNKENVTKAIDNISFKVEKGEFVGIMGPSGSGKTTLLNCISTIDTVTTGNIVINDKDITKLKSKQVEKFRRDELGFIFQDYNLLDNMNLMDNIALPLALGKKKTKDIENKVINIAEIFGLKEHLKKYPYELSGGQKQRGAAARALITDPKVIFADEPTGALDSRSSSDLLESLSRANKEENATIVMVTHDALTASYSNKVYILSDGEIKCQLNKGDNRKEFYGKIIDLLASLGGAK